jgi:hypothetical protein
MTSSGAWFVTRDIDGTKRVLYGRMRKHTIIALSFAVAALVACDVDRTPTLAGIGGGLSTAPIGSDSTQLLVFPSSAQIVLGGSIQLRTNVLDTAFQQLEWVSFNPLIATVSQTGLVTGGSLGSATIRVRLVGDTTNIATSVILVTAR